MSFRARCVVGLRGRVARGGKESGAPGSPKSKGPLEGTCRVTRTVVGPASVMVARSAGWGKGRGLLLCRAGRIMGVRVFGKKKWRPTSPGKPPMTCHVESGLPDGPRRALG